MSVLCGPVPSSPGGLMASTVDPVLGTSTVRDLVGGSGLSFAEHGRHTLEGIPGEWTILAVQE